jgi:hypothetical protein
VGAGRASFTFTSNARDNVFGSGLLRLPFCTQLHTLSTTRSLLVIVAFFTGFILTVIMKWEHIVWLAASTAGASPLLQFGQGGTFDYPGLRFSADKKFSITVFSDLHLGERKFKFHIASHTVLTVSSVMDRCCKRPRG